MLEKQLVQSQQTKIEPRKPVPLELEQRFKQFEKNQQALEQENKRIAKEQYFLEKTQERATLTRKNNHERLIKKLQDQTQRLLQPRKNS